MTSSSSKKRRLTRSSSLDFPTTEDLHEWLKPQIKAEDLRSWGKKPGTRTIHNLWIEHKNGESDLDDSTIPPRRIVNCAVVRILHRTDRTKVLLESRTELSDGSVRHIGRSLSQKIKAHESAKDAAVRGVKEELGPSYRVWIVGGPYEPKTTEMASDSFPGLPCSYVLHTVDAYVDGLQEEDFSTLERGEQEEELQKHGSSPVHKAVTVKKHFWKWGDDPDLLDGTVENRLTSARLKFKVFETDLVKRAVDSAKNANKGKKLLDGFPVIDYLISTAILLASLCESEAVVASGLLLDDSLCDMKEQYNALEKEFGKVVADLATDVSKLRNLSEISGKEQQENSKHWPDLILARRLDPLALMIKIAERTVQMMMLDKLNQEMKQRLVNETLHAYIPLSGRLGLNLWKSQLENSCAYASDEMKQSYASITETDVDDISFKVKLEGALDKEKLPYVLVEYRKKSLLSIVNKMSRKEIDFSKIRDIIGLRIIIEDKECYGEKDNIEKQNAKVHVEELCYKAKYVVENLWTAQPDFMKDYIKDPLPSGYRSLHVSVKNAKDQYMEVQIRTHEMHMAADGAHWVYKENSEVQEHVKSLVKLARATIEQNKLKETKVTGVEGNSSPHQIRMTSSSSEKRRLTRSSSLDFPTTEDLHEWLKPQIKAEDLMSWGKKPGTRTIHNLWIEHKNGESDLDDSTIPPRRIVNCAVVRILHRTDRTKVLLESRTELSDGSVRHIGRSLSQKIKAHESVKDAAVRGVKEELGPSYRVWIVGGPYEPKTTEMASDSFPGLPCSYVLHTVDAYVDGLQEEDFSTLERGEQEEELQKHGSSPVHKAVTVKKHFWKWDDDPDLLDGTVENLLTYARLKFKVFQTELVKRAVDSAKDANKGKKLLDGFPVIDYLISTAILLASLSDSDAVVASGLLLDGSRCCDIQEQYNALEKTFGKEIADLVTDVSKLSTLSERQENSKDLPDLILPRGLDPRALMIKIAERTVQMMMLDKLNQEMKQRLVNETLHVYIPLSERLGLNLWKRQLENLCAYASDEMKQLYASITETDVDDISFKVKLEDALDKKKLPYVRVECRKKSLLSIVNKMSRKEIDFSKIRDVIGLRIIIEDKECYGEKDNTEKQNAEVDVEELCYKAKDVVEKLWTPQPAFMKDYIKDPLPSGYRSLHVSVKNDKGQYMEVQIRTHEMHMAADGAYWVYKENSEVQEHVKSLVKLARATIEQACPGPSLMRQKMR